MPVLFKQRSHTHSLPFLFFLFDLQNDADDLLFWGEDRDLNTRALGLKCLRTLRAEARCRRGGGDIGDRTLSSATSVCSHEVSAASHSNRMFLALYLRSILVFFSC